MNETLVLAWNGIGRDLDEEFTLARVPYLSSSDAIGEVAELLAQLEARALQMRVIQAVANSSGAARNFARLGNSLIRFTKLDSRWRELVILHLAVVLDAPYEWYEHEPIARDVGVTAVEFEALRHGGLFEEVFDDRDRAVLKFAHAVVRHEMDDQLWTGVAEFLDVEEMTDLVLAAGWWGAMVPALVSALGIEPPST